MEDYNRSGDLMKKQNGKRILVKIGKSKFFAIFSVFVICISIILSNSYTYNSIISNKVTYFDENDEDDSDETESIDREDYLDKVKELYQKFLDNGSNIDINLYLATVVISESYAGIDHKDLWKKDIRTIFRCMNAEYDAHTYTVNYDEEGFRKNIKEHWITKKSKFKKLTKKYTDKELDKIVDSIYELKEVYEDIYGEDENVTGSNATTGGTCSYQVYGKVYSNVKVQLLKCEGNAKVNEEPYDFENVYIPGVVYLEVGEYTYEANKAQAVTARSFALTRPKEMGGAFGVKWDNNNILNLRNCVMDQAFCNPDVGCWSNCPDGPQTGWTHNCSREQSNTYSGYDSGKAWKKNKLPADDKARRAAKETYGQVAVDSKGNVLYLNFDDSDQSSWSRLSKEKNSKGQYLDYFEILKKHYHNKGVEIATITSNCTGGESSELGQTALSWRQYDPQWAKVKLGSRTIKEVGCMVTSTAIQIARSGTKINSETFDPGVFVDTVRNNNGFTGNDFNNDDSTWASIAPNFKVGGRIEFSNKDSIDTKIKKVTELINNGYYPIARIYKRGTALLPSGQHWVAITGVNNNKIQMADPGSDATDFCGTYNCNSWHFTRVYYYKAN